MLTYGFPSRLAKTKLLVPDSRRAVSSAEAQSGSEMTRRAPGSTHETKPSLPRRLDTIISKALEKDRAHRYQSAAEMRKDLLQVQEELRPGRHSPRKWLVALRDDSYYADQGLGG